MENRENRLVEQMGWLRTLRLLSVVTLALACWTEAVGAGCDGILQGNGSILHATVQIRDREPVRHALRVERSSELLVFARERDIDVMLEVSDAAGRTLARADTPIRRTGIQRLKFSAQAHNPYFLVLASKERATGWVDLEVVEKHDAANSVCLNAQEMLAQADQAYAVGQAVTRAMPGAPAVSSSKAYADAAGAYQSAIATLTGAGASTLLAQAQQAESAVMYQDIRNWEIAQKWAITAEDTYNALHDPYGHARAQALEAAALVEIALSVKSDSTSTDSPQRAAKLLQDARTTFSSLSEFHRKRGEQHDEALALNNIGYADYVEGRYDEAIHAFQQCLPLYHDNDRARQAQALQNIAVVEHELGRLSSAIPHFRQVLDLLDRNETPRLFAEVLGNSALANWAAGNEDVALSQYSQSLELSRTIEDTDEQAVALHGIASVYNTVGDQTRALDFYRQALALRKAPRDARGRTASLRAIANVLRQQGHADEALKLDREALSLASAPSTRERIAVQIARDLGDLGRPDEASRQLADILAQRAAGDDVEHARALQERARYRVQAKDFAAAEADLNSALATFHTFEAPTDEFAAWIALAQLLRLQHKSNAAFAAVDRALALAEEVRLQSANPELRSTLLQPLRPAFDLKISMLADQYVAARGNGRLQRSLALRALVTAEQARARALADYQNLDVTAPGLDPQLLQRRRTVYREIAARRFRLETTLDRSGTGGDDIRAIRSEIALLRRDLDEIDAQIGAASQSAAAGTHGNAPQQTTLKIANIPLDAAIVEYWLGTDTTFAWVVTRGGITLTRLGPTSQVTTQAMALHAAMRAYGSVSKASRLESGEQLYDTLLAPVELQIREHRTLIFAPDGALHYVPFATLRPAVGGKRAFLVENHDLAVTPSIEMLLRAGKPGPAKPAAKQMLLVADPVYTPADSRIAKTSPGATPAGTRSAGATAATLFPMALLRGPGTSDHLERLPGATREAAAIAALLPSAGVDRLEGLSATRERFLAAALQDYRFIHIASHATSDSEIPQASALILSTVDGQGRDIDGRVLAADFMGVRLQADAVVLIGCDTALGRSIAGEGLVGLHYVALARGARSVVSSLWPALDQVTAELMVRFYSTLLHENSSVIAAWSSASRAMLPGRYADPGTWGAFMLTLSHIEDVQSH